MSLSGTDAESRVFERFNYLLKNKDYYNKKIFDLEELSFRDREIVLWRPSNFYVVRGNRILLEHSIPPSVLRSLNSTKKSAGRGKDFNFDTPDAKESGYVQEKLWTGSKKKKFFERRLPEFNRLANEFIETSPHPECEIFRRLFEDGETEHTIHKTMKIPRRRLNRIIKGIFSQIKNQIEQNVPDMIDDPAMIGDNEL